MGLFNKIFNKLSETENRNTDQEKLYQALLKKQPEDVQANIRMKKKQKELEARGTKTAGGFSSLLSRGNNTLG